MAFYTDFHRGRPVIAGAHDATSAIVPPDLRKRGEKRFGCKNLLISQANSSFNYRPRTKFPSWKKEKSSNLLVEKSQTDLTASVVKKDPKRTRD